MLRSPALRESSPPDSPAAPAEPATRLRIRLFGGMHFSWGDGPPLDFPTQKAQSLFAFLALNRQRMHRREAVSGVFWGDRPEESARKCLRTTLWRVRRVLDLEDVSAAHPLMVSSGGIGFNTQVDYWLDVEEFERRMRAVRGSGRGTLQPAEAQMLEEAVALYRGDLLDAIYDDWCVHDRERLRLMYLSALERLMLHHEACGAWDQAIAAAQRLLASDPILEHVHRAVMRCYFVQGNRPAALRQFALCVRTLRTELDVEPMEETTAVFEEIRRAEPGRPSPSTPRQELLVERAERLLEEARTLLPQLASITLHLEQARKLYHPQDVPARETIR
jgi:DNA-binding SARP family transcriptional activator